MGNYSIGEVPSISNVNDLKDYIKPLYIIDDYMSSHTDYFIFQEKMYNIMKGCVEHKECREYPIKFKFYKNSTETFTLEFRHFIVNMFSWFPYTELHGLNVLNKHHILDCVNCITSKKFPEFINKVIIPTLRDYNIKNTIINYDISEMLYNLRRISIDFSLILALPMNAELFIDGYNSNERLREIMTTKFSADKQPSEVEEELNALMNEEINIFKSMKTNPVGVILRSGTGIKFKQLAEFTINGGFKPNLDGNTIPIPINSNTMIGGLNKVSSLYTDGLGARYALLDLAS